MTSPEKEDYLWDRKGAADPVVHQLEQALRPMRQAADAQQAIERRARRLRPVRWWIPAGIAATLLLALGTAWVATAPVPWSTQTIRGRPRIDVVQQSTEGVVTERRTIETPAGSEVRVHVGRIGQVLVGPGSRLYIDGAGAGARTLLLERGSLVARISAAPGDFVVNTPSAKAVDLGCVYRLTVDSAGNGSLVVVEGAVRLEAHGITVTAPAGHEASILNGGRLGLPRSLDATMEQRAVVNEIDTLGVTPARVAHLLRLADASSVVTLWHLLQRVTGDERRNVVERLVRYVPAPPGVLPESLWSNDGPSMKRWEALVMPGSTNASTWWRREMARRGFGTKPTLPLDVPSLPVQGSIRR